MYAGKTALFFSEKNIFSAIFLRFLEQILIEKIFSFTFFINFKLNFKKRTLNLYNVL